MVITEPCGVDRVGLSADSDAGACLLCNAKPFSLGSVASFGQGPRSLDAMAFDGSRAALSSALPLKRSRVAGPIQSFSYRAA
jgi:hypothetical protein